jgi:DNA replication and repair protein RecF
VFVKQVWLEQYRNIQTACIQPARHLTVLYGCNGQGKTNFLESVYLLGNARPFRSAKVPDLICHGSRTAAVRGSVVSAGVESDIFLRLEQNTRRITVDGKAIQRAADLHGKLAVVIFSPDDTAMVKLGPETRRRYLDRSLYASDAGFLQDYHSYYRILKQRNALLKTNQQEGLDLWTEQLAEAGSRLMDHRQRYAERLNHLLQQKYQQIAGEQEKVTLVYQPDVPCTAEDNRAEALQIVLNNQREQDLRYKTTGRGPHRDDLTFLIGGRPLKGFGSQGQQRSFVLALKMAELDHLQETFGEMPVLLLDDIASELDRERMKNLLSYVRQREVQVLITTTDVTPFLPVLQQDSKLFLVEEGRLTYEGNGTP